MHEEFGGAPAAKKSNGLSLASVLALGVILLAAAFVLHAWLRTPPDSRILKVGQPIVARLMPSGFKSFEMEYDDFRLVCRAKVAADHQAEWPVANNGRLKVRFDVLVDQASFDLSAEKTNGGEWVIDDTDATAERIDVKAFEAQIQSCLTALHDRNAEFVKAQKEHSVEADHNLKSWQAGSSDKS